MSAFIVSKASHVAGLGGPGKAGQDGNEPTPHTLHMGRIIVADCAACRREVARGNLTTEVTTHVTTEVRQCLRDAATVIGKVVADNLMPGIAQPQYPAAVLARIETLLARLDAAPAEGRRS